MVLTKPGLENGTFYFFSDPKDNDWIIIFEFICAVTSTLIGLGLCFCHFIRLCHIYKTSKIEENMDENEIHIEDIFPSRNDKHKLGIIYYYIWSYHILTIFAILFGLSTAIIADIYQTLRFLDLLSGCSWSVYASNLCWNAVKFCVYCMGIIRILNTFNGSYFDYSNRIKICLCVYAICCVGYTLCHFIFLSYSYDIKENGVFKWCQFGMNLISTIIAGLFDGAMNTILLILFIKPAIILSKNADHKPEKVLNVISKVGLLMGVVITTSLIGIGLLWFGLVALMYFDVMINIGCMLLMHKTNEIFYNKLCNRFHKKIYIFCNNYIDRQRNKIKSKSGDIAVEL